MQTNDWTEQRMQESLRQRQAKGTLRRLPAAADDEKKVRDSNDLSNNGSKETVTPWSCAIDFSSNDYLGLAQSKEQAKRVEELFQQQADHPTALLGATGSRLLSGDATAFHDLESYLAQIHQQPAALLCNSGYDANLSLVSSLPCDVIVYDDLAHNSLHMAMRLWQTRQENHRQWIGFAHNSVDDLRAKLANHCREGAAVVVIVESVYSMDGDCAPLAGILDLAATYGARVVVDEAHGLGACGPAGLLAALGLHQHEALLSAVYTFGKAAGCHGAVITGSPTLKSYLVNFGYPFIYSTALPWHSLCTIRASYETMTSVRGGALRDQLRRLIQVFQNEMQAQVAANPQWNVSLIASTTAIQALVVPGNQRCSDFCARLRERSHRRIRLFPIKSPTVPAGMERVRIVLHAHNTETQVRELIGQLCACLGEESPLSPRLLMSKL